MTEFVLLHIGTHKTGSTSLQEFLSRSADVLREDGILYPDNGRPENLAPHGHHELAWSLQKKRNRTQYEGWSEVSDEIKGSACQRVVISSEVFETCSTDEIRLIRRLLPTSRIKVLIYLRDPFSYMVSMYKQYIRSQAESRPFRGFAKCMIDLCDYKDLIGRWRKELGDESVIIRSFDRCRDGVPLEKSLVDLMGLDNERYIRFVSEPANVSPDTESLVVVRWLNRMREELLVPEELAHRISRNIIRDTARGRWFVRVMTAFLRDALLRPGDDEWFHRLLSERVDEPLNFGKEVDVNALVTNGG